MTASQSTLDIVLDAGLAREAGEILGDLGMDVPTAVELFLREVVEERGLPFRPHLDPFYNPANIARLQRAIEDVRAGRNVEEHGLIDPDA